MDAKNRKTIWRMWFSGFCVLLIYPRKGVDLSGVALVGSFFNEKRAFFGGIDFIGGDNAGGFPDFYL